jgi:transcriptional regulator NrdR family protein
VTTGCAHEHTRVIESRSPDFAKREKKQYKQLPIFSFVRRRRQCEVCGQKINTAEVIIEELEELLDKRTGESIVREFIEFMKAREEG